MKGIYNKVVKLIIPILNGDSDSQVELRNKPDNIDFNKLVNKYNITILQEFNKIPPKILHQNEKTKNKSNLSIYLVKNNNIKSSLCSIKIKKNKRNEQYTIKKIEFDSSVSFKLNEKRKRPRNEDSNGDNVDNENQVVKRQRSNSENFVATNDDEKFSFDKLVSATKTRNYILDDGILDFLDYYSKNPKKHSLTFNEIVGFDTGYNTRSKNNSRNIKRSNHGNDNLTDMIKEEGIKYEKKVMEELSEKVNNYNPPIVIETIENTFDVKSSFELTKRLMKEGKEIIYQAVLYNDDDETFGCPDLVIRSDVLTKLFGDSYITENTKINYRDSKNKLNNFYVVIDIKHSHLDFNADERTLRNTETLKPYKSQLCVYNNALSKIQGFDPKFALVLGKSYTIKGIKHIDYFNKLGVIDYENRDIDYVEKTKDAVNWIRKVREDGKYWVLDPVPSVKELFPRMNNEKDGKWKSIKQKVADNVGEISSVYYCGIKERKAAHEKNIYSWRDERCNTLNMGFNQNSKSKIPMTIDKILDINRSLENSNVNVLPEVVKTDVVDNFNWRTSNNDSMEFYMDFETMNSNFFEVSNFSNDNVIVFQLGVGYIDSNNKWIYKAFVSKNKTYEEEKNMFLEFFKFVNESFIKEKKEGRNDYHFVHWYPHEKICYEKIRSSMNLPVIKFMDLSKLFREEPIVVKGSLRFKLKSISTALYNMGLIKSSWDFSSDCNSGLAAMALASKIYEEEDIVTEKNINMNEIIKYNEVDCKVLWEIIDYLRNNH